MVAQLHNIFRTTAPAPHLNGKHMVFGHVLSGREVVAKIEAVPVSDTRIYKPIKPVVIVNCGELVPGMIDLLSNCF